MPALAPRNDVVAFHILKGVLGVDAICNAQGALVTLPLIGAKLLVYSTIIRQSAAKRNAVPSESGRYSIVFICNGVLALFVVWP